MMYRLFPGFARVSNQTLRAMAEARERGDVSQVPVLVEVLRFLPSEEAQREAVLTLESLTGQSLGDDWGAWMEWLGRNAQDYPPPEGYLEWKLNILAQIDPRFRLFFKDAERTARIRLTEVVWGGVVPDGIPDLRNPKTVPPEEADYLRPDDRVFGVTINGQSRAYPLRIVNAHEMVNDVLGGEPIALSW